MKPFLSIIIPAYNEEKKLPLTLIDAERHLAEVDYSWEIIVLSDGSSDGTVDVVNRFSRLIPNLRLIANTENHGKGYVVRQGMLQAHGNWRLFADADNSTSVDQFNQMMPYFKEGYDVVIGSRAIKGSRLTPAESLFQRLANNLFNFFVRLLILPGFRDTQCGFKCFSETAASRIFNLATIDRWGFDIEILALARMMHFRIKEVPVRWVYNPSSAFRWSSYFSLIWDVLEIRFRFWRRKYKFS